jgi:hypothetical protein
VWGSEKAVFAASSITELQSLSSTTCAAVCALLVPPKYTIPSPSCTRQDNKLSLAAFVSH